MKYAIVAITKTGIQTGRKLREKLKSENPNTSINNQIEVDFYVKGSFLREDNLCMDEILVKEKLNLLTKSLFENYHAIVFIMATGIVSRIIAPYIVNKTEDPAVIVMDERGKFAISLLSGHIGKGNEITTSIAECMKSIPVITTASDISNKLSVDMFAKKYDLAMNCMEEVKTVTSLSVNDFKVGILFDSQTNDYKFNIGCLEIEKFPSNIEVIDEENIPIENIEYMKSFDGIIFISNRSELKDYFVKRNFKKDLKIAQLIPKNIVIGMGCKRGKTFKELYQELRMNLRKYNLNEKSIKTIASVDIKADEKGLIELAEYLNVEFRCFKVHELELVEDKFEGSAFVKKTIGVSSVSEPSGYLASNRGKNIMPVVRSSGTTISIWRILE